ncbi:protein yippee-like At3g55890 isoform X2 [Daucus carota subsp. sativus]|uniref:protein yippee-like At3g55890 isoform X2 n=1 Tax=Daucus carota subsp. sativus TaxID=79200 RepID=UPI003083D187
MFQFLYIRPSLILLSLSRVTFEQLIRKELFFGVIGEMGRLFVQTLEGSIYSCKHCKTHLAVLEDIMSKAFSSRHGKAYLFRNVANVTLGEKEERMMITGMHIVADIFCVCCGSNVGWKYESAYEKSQKYKEGKFILESPIICKSFG